MGYGVFVVIVTGIILLILSVLSFFFIKSLGRKKLAYIVSISLASVVIIPFFLFAFESFLYFKSDVKNDLELAHFHLEDNFEILENDITGTIDYYQKTQIKISSKDKNRIIQQISNSPNFHVSTETNHLLSNSINDDSKLETNYFYDNRFIREVYIKEKDYVPVYMIIFIDSNSNSLEIQRIED